MRKKYAKLDRIEHNDPITKESHYQFLFKLQIALLLALREQGKLNPMQHRYAQESLIRQRREHSIRRQGKT